MNLFAFGSNGSGQLGIGHEEDVSTPTKCLFASTEKDEPKEKDKIIQIVAGGNHTVLLTELGYVYAVGCNTDGRCGIQSSPQEKSEDSNTTIINRFQRVILTDTRTGAKIERFKHIAATWEGSILVAEVSLDGTKEDKVFVHGSSPKGELGTGNPPAPAPSVAPGTSIPNFPPTGTKILALAASMSHAVCILSNNSVYGWGGSRKGQLGENLKPEKIIWTPSKVSGIPFTATSAVCGREFTVIVGDRRQGQISVLGDRANRWGILETCDSAALQERIRARERDWDPVQQQGNGNGNQARKEASVGSSDANAGASVWGFEEIGASWHGIYVLVRFEKGESEQESSSDSGCGIVAWGRNDRGQLPGSGTVVRKMAIGSEHGLVVLGDGSVAAFGWGEHGNCGPETDQRGNVTEYQVLCLPDGCAGRVIGVGAGCATSWLILD